MDGAVRCLTDLHRGHLAMDGTVRCLIDLHRGHLARLVLVF